MRIAMLKHIKRIICLITYILMLAIPGTVHAEEAVNSYPEATVTSINKLNMRSGPGTGYDVVHQLNPQESVYVVDTDNTHAGWAKVLTKDNIKGYVSSKYLSEKQPSQPNSSSDLDDKFYKTISYMFSPLTYLFTACYLYLIEASPIVVVLIFFLVGLLETGLIYLLQKKYKDPFYNSAKPAAWTLVITFLLTRPIYNISLTRTTDEWDMLISVLMLLSTSCLMLHAAWRIQQCGMIMGWKINPKSKKYNTGRWIGNILWGLLLIPIGKTWFALWENFYYRIPDGWGYWALMFLSFLVINLCIAYLIWPFIVKHLFHIANQGIVHIMSILMLGGIAYAEYHILGCSYEGLKFWVGLFILYIQMVNTYKRLWCNILEHRCPNCHCFAGICTAVKELGVTRRVSEHTESENPYNINQHNYNAIVVDAERTTETTTFIRHWVTYHQCTNCFSEWEVHHSEIMGEYTRVIEQKWTEIYFR